MQTFSFCLYKVSRKKRGRKWFCSERLRVKWVILLESGATVKDDKGDSFSAVEKVLTVNLLQYPMLYIYTDDDDGATTYWDLFLYNYVLSVTKWKKIFNDSSSSSVRTIAGHRSPVSLWVLGLLYSHTSLNYFADVWL